MFLARLMLLKLSARFISSSGSLIFLKADGETALDHWWQLVGFIQLLNEAPEVRTDQCARHKQTNPSVVRCM